MDDADSDADTEVDNFKININDNRYSLWYIDTTGYAFLYIKIHMRP